MPVPISANQYNIISFQFTLTPNFGSGLVLIVPSHVWGRRSEWNNGIIDCRAGVISHLYCKQVVSLDTKSVELYFNVIKYLKLLNISRSVG